ncbi:uncharacterized protein LOC144156131 isoform X3 [Haemaphysalis longicornis]
MAPTNSRCFGLECESGHQAPPVSPDMAKAVRTLVLIHYRNHVGDLAAWPPRSLHCWCSTTTCGCLWTRLSGWDGGTAAGRPERILGTTPVLACGRQPACLTPEICPQQGSHRSLKTLEFRSHWWCGQGTAGLCCLLDSLDQSTLFVLAPPQRLQAAHEEAKALSWQPAGTRVTW